MIKVNKLTKTFDTDYGKEKVLKNIHFEVKQGEFVTIMGPSGGGKSTLLYMLGLLSKPTSGEVYLNGKKINYDDERFLDNYRRKNIGFVFQNSNLISSLTPLENLIIAMNSKDSNKEKIKRAEKLLAEIGLKGKENSKISSLSGGEAQRAAVVRALVNDPEIVLCDEPTGSLDSRNGKKVIKLLQDYQAGRNGTLVIVTHDKNVAQLGDRKYYLMDGELNALC